MYDSSSASTSGQRRGRCSLLILDAQDLAKGPVARYHYYHYHYCSYYIVIVMPILNIHNYD